VQDRARQLDGAQAAVTELGGDGQGAEHGRSLAVHRGRPHRGGRAQLDGRVQFQAGPGEHLLERLAGARAGFADHQRLGGQRVERQRAAAP
jgi:hypothetical protein